MICKVWAISVVSWCFSQDPDDAMVALLSITFHETYHLPPIWHEYVYNNQNQHMNMNFMYEGFMIPHDPSKIPFKPVESELFEALARSLFEDSFSARILSDKPRSYIWMIELQLCW